MSTRRNFVKKAGAGLFAMGASSMLFNEELYGSSIISKPNKEEDMFKVSMAGYSFQNFFVCS